jgi:EpsD family peptidyl-prolyl cis-trans isomerase
VSRVLLVVFLLTPAACERAAADRPATQLVAKVNGIEISAEPMRAAAPGAAAQALEKVIDRELLVQKALAAKLDRDPQVAHAMESARRQVLAQAWLDRAATAAAGGSRPEDRSAEVRAFYQENPALFAERRIYRLRELVVPAPAELLETLGAEAARAQSLDEVVAWLRSRNVKFSAHYHAGVMTQPAEHLPLAFLPRLSRMQPGEIAVFPTPPGASVIQLVHAEDAPLGESQAAPVIEQFLAGRKRLESAAAEVRRLREVATIEYLGDFKRGN